jgi:predicted PurR-regulated permease PerM
MSPRRRRAFVSDLLIEIVHALRWWLLGQLIAMAVIGVTTGVVLTLLGVPGAVLLGIQAGLLNFIPYLGAFLAAIPILLAAASQGMTTLVWVAVAYVVIQIIEGYIMTPLILKRTVHVPPVVTLASLMIFGALFGSPGLAMATPLAAALRVIVLRLQDEERSTASLRASRKRLDL